MITELSKQYQVSRTFIYSLLSHFKTALGHLIFPDDKPAALPMESIEARILAQRFEGRSSIDAISTLMKREGLSYSATGSISQILSRLGDALPNVLKNNKAQTQVLVFADDEIFAKSFPILITVDPVSSAILSIELVEQRMAEKWEQHLGRLADNGFLPRLLASDAGTAIKSAHEKVFTDTP